MNALKRLWLQFRIESYTNDALYLTETAERCRRDAIRARAKAAELHDKLLGLCVKVHEHRDTLVGWIVIVGSCFALWAFGKWT